MYYISSEMAKNIHATTIDVSGGGVKNSIHFGQLESVLENIQNDEYYPTFIDKLTHLFYCTCEFHCFADGNKRLAISLSAQFLLLNGYLNIVSEFIKDMENISYHVAAGKIDKDLLHDIFESFFNGTFDNEEIKLRIINAITV